MRPNSILIQDSFALIKPKADDLVEKLFDTLWKRQPRLALLFEPADMQKQKQVFLSTLIYIVNNIDDTNKLSALLVPMGQRHANYGARPEHFQFFELALLDSFEYFLKEKWTQEVRDEWSKAFALITDFMNCEIELKNAA